MVKLHHILSIALSVISLTACSSGGEDEPGGGDKPTSGKYALSGKVEKGPFVQGSAISVQPLNESMTAIGTVFNGEISDDAGDFDLGSVELASQFVRLAADGYYFNEVSGDLSSGQLHLVAIADLKDKSTVNVNILTHLKSGRVQKLMKGGKSFKDANAQAQKELLEQFGLQRFTSSAEGWSITAGTDEAGALIAISSLILYDRTEAEITQYLSRLTQELADNGKFSNSIKQDISDNSRELKRYFSDISNNIVSRYNDLGKSVTVKDLKYFFDWDGDGTAGNEFVENPQITLSPAEVSFPKEGGEADITITANFETTLEKHDNPFDDEEPGSIVVPSVFFSGYYATTGEEPNLESKLNGNKLHIKITKTNSREEKTYSVPIYDMFGKAQASVSVKLAGDPSIEMTLGTDGGAIVNATVNSFATGFGWMYYTERGYTGMYPFHDVQVPFAPDNYYVGKCYNEAYLAIAHCNNFIDALKENNLPEATAMYNVLKAILYIELVDKWGNVIISDGISPENAYNITQSSASDVLNHALGLLNDADKYITKERTVAYATDENVMHGLSKDVTRAAKANAYMALGEYNTAATLLREIVDGNRYQLNSTNDYDMANKAVILGVQVPNEIVNGHAMPIYSYSDIVLALAECHYKRGNTAEASNLIKKVAIAKGLQTTGDIVEDLASIRKQLFTPHYFAFQKRNALGGYEEYQKLWPIPAREMTVNPNMRQNPGY